MARKVSLDVLDDIRVASPCSMSWDSMTGDERNRLCAQCGLHVHNLEAMTRDEALALVAEASLGGRVCVRFYRRADGKVLTRDCPVGRAAVRARARHFCGRVAALLALLLSGSWLLARGESRAERFADAQPFSTLRDWFRPAPSLPVMTAGMMMCPPSAQSIPVPGADAAVLDANTLARLKEEIDTPEQLPTPRSRFQYWPPDKTEH